MASKPQQATKSQHTNKPQHTKLPAAGRRPLIGPCTATRTTGHVNKSTLRINKLEVNKSSMHYGEKGATCQRGQPLMQFFHWMFQGGNLDQVFLFVCCVVCNCVSVCLFGLEVASLISGSG